MFELARSPAGQRLLSPGTSVGLGTAQPDTLTGAPVTLKVGDKVRIVAGKGKGHVGILVRHLGGSVVVRSATLGLGDGVGQEYSVPCNLVEPAPFAGAVEPRTAAPWRDYRPKPFLPPRPGSMAASQLPSIMGGVPVRPRSARS